MVDSAARRMKGRGSATLYELLPAPDQLCVHSSEGSFSHEMIVLMSRTAEPSPANAPDRGAGKAASLVPRIAHDPATPRRFLPGSSWLFLKLYTGMATADELLRDYLAPAIRAAIEQQLATGWFFIRYGDPDWHIRLRFTGDPHRLTSELLPFLHRALAPASEAGLLWRIVVDTYEREVERYG